MDRNSNFQDQAKDIYIYIYNILVVPSICLFWISCITVSDFASDSRDILKTKFSQFWLRSRKEQKVTRGPNKASKREGVDE
jgi:hypothetical protein